MWKAYSISNWIVQIQLIEHGLKHPSWFLQHILVILALEIFCSKQKECYRLNVKTEVGDSTHSVTGDFNNGDDNMGRVLSVSLFLCAVWNNDFKFRHQSGYRIKRLRILPVQSGLWHSLLSAQWPRHSDPPWAAAEHCLVLCWVPLAQVTEQSLQELHSCHCPSTEAPTTTQQACPMWRGRDGRQKWEEIFRSLIFFGVKANTTNKKMLIFSIFAG